MIFYHWELDRMSGMEMQRKAGTNDLGNVDTVDLLSLAGVIGRGCRAKLALMTICHWLGSLLG
jgi:hypothetical protein